ncbi:hypothetical protein Sya03_53310 [Spirilliplanes yamanashiensis]|uniref:Uncharacterized protein n=1 Tax=Spirilliplanes yamanashiensis TaxID=42233 RepID=A0A8J3YDM7_9ACTN|nr:hypothetical protein Sya03_53310 [Spirilliplanes yamanashiensis]
MRSAGLSDTGLIPSGCGRYARSLSADADVRSATTDMPEIAPATPLFRSVVPAA